MHCAAQAEHLKSPNVAFPDGWLSPAWAKAERIETPWMKNDLLQFPSQPAAFPRAAGSAHAPGSAVSFQRLQIWRSL